MWELSCVSTLTGRNWTDSLALVQCERQPRAEAAFQRMAMAKCSLEHPGPSSSLGRRVSQLKKKTSLHWNNCHPNPAPQCLGARGLLTLSEPAMSGSFSAAFRRLTWLISNTSIFVCIVSEVQKCGVSRGALIVTLRHRNACCKSMNTLVVV